MSGQVNSAWGLLRHTKEGIGAAKVPRPCGGTAIRTVRSLRHGNRSTGRLSMSDPDRDVERERTTIVETDRGGGGGGVLAVVLLIIVVLVLLYLFRDQLGFGSRT